MQRDSILHTQWAYEWGVVLKGIEQVWQHTGEQRYLDYIRQNIDAFVEPDGTIRTYHPEEYNLDRINTGKLLFGMRRMTGDARYEKAARALRHQLHTHPRTQEGGFWHKKIYPHQMWLDGIYMQGPFYAEFARTFDEPAAFDDVARQITLIARHTHDPHTGLLYHGWDESRTQRWANVETGCSPHFWGRALGWFLMALVDVLEQFPVQHPQRADIERIYLDAVQAVIAVQDQPSGLWYQVLDQGDRPGNYLEASASCMFIYAIARGVTLGLLDHSRLTDAWRAYTGVLRQLVTVDDQGLVNLNQVCSVAGLGGTPYRDGSYDYYISEPVVTNDQKGVGAFILAGAALELQHG